MHHTPAIPFESLAGWVTVAEAARLLKLSPRAIQYRIQRHRLPVLTLGRAFLVRVSDLRLTGKSGA